MSLEQHIKEYELETEKKAYCMKSENFLGEWVQITTDRPAPKFVEWLSNRVPIWVSVEDFKDMPLGSYVVKYNGADGGIYYETDEWLGETFGFENFERKEWDSITDRSIISAMPLPIKTSTPILPKKEVNNE